MFDMASFSSARIVAGGPQGVKRALEFRFEVTA